MPQSQAHKSSDAYEVYKLDAQSRHVTQATLRTYDDRIKPFILWCESRKAFQLQELTPTLVRSYLVHLQDRQLSSYTVNGVARAIRAFFNFCVDEGLLAASPMRRVAIPKVDKKILPALSVDDAQKLLAACASERDEALLLFMLDTGTRSTEFINLNGADIDIATGSVVIQQSKGHKDCIVYLGAKARKQLLRYYMETRDARRRRSCLDF